MTKENKILEVVQLGIDAGKNPDPSIYTFSDATNVLLIVKLGKSYTIIDRKSQYIFSVFWFDFNRVIQYINDNNLATRYDQIWVQTDSEDDEGNERDDCMVYPIFASQPETYIDMFSKEPYITEFAFPTDNDSEEDEDDTS